MPTATRATQAGRVFHVLLVVLLASIVFFALAVLVGSNVMSLKFDEVQVAGLPAATKAGAAFTEAWTAEVDPPVIRDLALAPGIRGQFFALNNNVILRFDSSGAALGEFDAPSKSSRLVSDPLGRLPYLLVVSSKTKWTGAIDYTETTDLFLQALDVQGRPVWQKRFDPKTYSALEPVIAFVEGAPVILLSAGQRVAAFAPDGRELWDVALWHHPGTLAAADFDGDRNDEILAALAPRKEIVRLDSRGNVLGAWGQGDGPGRLRASEMGAASFRQVFGRGPNVAHALAFFAPGGGWFGEIELPPEATPLSYVPLAAIDAAGNGRRDWVMAFGDGSVQVFSPSGTRRALFHTGQRLRGFIAVPQSSGPDLLVTANHRGLTAWRPVPGRLAAN